MSDKKCKVCKTVKPIDEFYLNYRANDGHSSKCKSCQHDYNVRYVASRIFPLADIKSKVCHGCKIEKDISEYGRDKHRKDGHIDYCFDCRTKRVRLMKLRNPMFNIIKNKRVRYGLSQEQYETMLKDQGGVCAICGEPETRKNAHGEIDALSVDHSHITQINRGLLCNRCNVAIGRFGDRLDLLEKATAYLRKHQ